MNVSKEVKEKWDKLYQIGDIELIRKEMPPNKRVSYEWVRRSLRSGEYKNRFVFRAVVSVYSRRVKELEKL